MGMQPAVELGSGVTIQWTSWGQHERVGFIEYHTCQGGSCNGEDHYGAGPGMCGGGVMFDLPGVREAFPHRALWTVQSWEPLTLSPSIACGCKGCTHHGYVRDGVWVPA
jgi:hypothetical protein